MARRARGLPCPSPARSSDDSMVVHFDTNVAPGLPWKFAPEQNQVEAKLGETKTVFFRVKNTGDKPTRPRRDLQRPARPDGRILCKGGLLLLQ